MTAASRLVGELMPVSVLVAGHGAPALAAELETAGAAAEVLAGPDTAEGFDLAILLADASAAGQDDVRATIVTLSGASERLLFAPLPLRDLQEDGDAAGAPALPELTQWFEVFAEFGYQPVVDFDASFVSPGAFLVDRAATAAESELSAFADRLQLGTDPRREAASPEAAATDLLRTSLAETEAALRAARTELEASQADRAGLTAKLEAATAEAGAGRARQGALETANAGWEGLRGWVRAVAGDATRDSLANLARDLPRLNELRGTAPAIVLPKPRPRRLWPARLWRRGRAETLPPVLADAALVRASRLFDAAWYIASTPGLHGEALDPVFHYVLVGGPNGEDPGPWFDTRAYLAAHPELAGTQACPLVHAIRTGADRDMQAA